MRYIIRSDQHEHVDVVQRLVGGLLLSEKIRNNAGLKGMAAERFGRNEPVGTDTRIRENYIRVSWR